MAEGGFIEGVLGEEAEERAESGSGAGDAAAIALAMDEAKRDPELAAKAGAYLDTQRALAQLQIKHFDEERRLAIVATRRKAYADRIRNAFSTLAAAGVLIVLISIGGMVIDAAGDHGLVIEAFSTPAEIARDGLTGQVIAQRVLDKLEALQAATVAERPATSYQNNWGAELKVEIPETGISLGEVQKLLRERLGHAQHVRGEVVRTANGIALTTRLDEEPGETAEGPVEDLDALAQKSAEALYRASQPYRYARYLLGLNRRQEAQEVAEALANSADAQERPWAYNLLATLDLAAGDLKRASAAVKTAEALGGAGGEQAHINAATIALWSGHDEALFKESLYLDTPGFFERTAAEVTPATTASNRLISSGYLASQLGDFGRAVHDYRALANGMVRQQSFGFQQSQVAWALARAHDPAGAAAALEEAGPQDVDFYLNEAASGWFSIPDYQLAAERGDWAGALADLRRVDALIEAGKAAQPSLSLLQPALVRPLIARALLKTGDLAGAQTQIATTAMDCDLCLRVRGEIAAAGRDATGADRAFAAAVRQAPDLPFAYTEWAQAKLDRGDVKGALALFETAHAKGPRFADALKGWGDALARTGELREAIAKYDAALKLTPDWADLRTARDAAKARAG
jgi:tetratricopeptide (TPR) repeat protein